MRRVQLQNGGEVMEESNFCCGACGEIVSHEEGEQIVNGGFVEFVHRADKCEISLDELADKFGNCQLCGETIVSGLSVEPFGNCCDKCVNEIKGAQTQTDVIKLAIDATTREVF